MSALLPLGVPLRSEWCGHFLGRHVAKVGLVYMSHGQKLLRRDYLGILSAPC